MNTKKDIFQKHKEKIQNFSFQMNCQHIFNALLILKSVVVYFKDVKTEETFSSQDQTLVETSNL